MGPPRAIATRRGLCIIGRRHAKGMGMRATPTVVPGTEPYRNFHLWMLLPFAITLLGFAFSYFSRLGEATFHQHVHGLSATLWYILVLVQPWLVTRRGDVKRHRLYGAFATLVAGIVAGSALTIIPKNIDDVTTLDPNGFFNPTFAYFACIIDLVLIGLFIASVMMAIVAMKRRDLPGHVQWMMASVFAVLSPALARMLGTGMIIANQGNMEGITLIGLTLPSVVVMLALITLFYWRFGSFRHPSYWWLLAAHIPYLFVVPLGDSAAVQSVLAAIFK
jgi:hypothetical protein